MSRSYKKPYGTVVCYSSNKQDKSIAHKLFRAKEREELHKVLEDNAKLPYYMREVSNTYNFSSDGLAWYMNDIAKECKNIYGWYKWFKK